MPRAMRRFNRDYVNVIVRLFAGFAPPLAVMYHVGRKTGMDYRTPIVAFRTETGFLVPLPYGVDTDWCQNVMEIGGGTVHAYGEKIGVENPRILDTEDALPLLPGALRSALRAADLPGYLLVDRRWLD